MTPKDKLIERALAWYKVRFEKRSERDQNCYLEALQDAGVPQSTVHAVSEAFGAAQQEGEMRELGTFLRDRKKKKGGAS